MCTGINLLFLQLSLYKFVLKQFSEFMFCDLHRGPTDADLFPILKIL